MPDELVIERAIDPCHEGSPNKPYRVRLPDMTDVRAIPIGYPPLFDILEVGVPITAPLDPVTFAFDPEAFERARRHRDRFIRHDPHAPVEVVISSIRGHGARR